MSLYRCAVFATMLASLGAPSIAAPAPVVPVRAIATPHGVLTPTPNQPNRVVDGNRVRLVYGTITAIRDKTLLVVRLRNGYPLMVDAAKAIESGKYSAPLFVGKLVSVLGHPQPNGRLRAITITRVAKLEKTGVDRWVELATPRP